MALRFLQANLNHSARAQDLLIQSMAEWLIKVAVVSEPYYIPPRYNWFGDSEQLVAIVVQSAADSPLFTSVAKGRGCVAALVGNIVIVAVYFSPNRALVEFESFLVEVRAIVEQSGTHPVIVAGDFNAKSMAWGSPATDARGEMLEEWALTTGLSILNRGSEHTCVRQQGGSIVDLTFASTDLAHYIRGWEVLVEAETLSDHRYIRFDVGGQQPTSIGPASNATRRRGPRWAIKCLDKDLLEEASLIQAWVSAPTCVREVQEETKWLREALTSICDAAMPRVKATTSKRRVYWWSMELAELRKACVTARRQYSRQRRRRHRSEAAEAQLYESYRGAVNALQLAISQAKEQAHNELLESLNRDPWGRPYKTVRAKLRPWTPPITQILEPQLLEEVVSALFPDREEHIPPVMVISVGETSMPADEDSGAPEITEVEMRVAVQRLRAKNTAPGPDGIPGRACALAIKFLGPKIRGLFDACLDQGRFPKQWKEGRLVLLRKEGRSVDSPSAYRPIVVLDEMGKLLERIIAGRLNRYLGCVGSDLADNQFGFRRGRSAVGAILRVKALANEAISRGEVVLAISLDIANAFNTMPWSCIKEALIYHQMPLYLRRIVGDYLTERYVTFEGRQGPGRRSMSCGVPQGSVLGPLLWNVGYDWVLRGMNLPGVEVTCYADDTLVTAAAKTFREAAILATAGVAQVVGRIRTLGLEVALHKSEALLFHGPRRGPPENSHIVVGGVHIAVESTMKYLGLVLDSRWNFQPHFQMLVPKLMGAAAKLGGLLPNMRGANVSCRRLYMGIVRSMALYGAPVWADTLTSRSAALLRKPQRAMAIRVVRGYRTISFEAACTLAGTTPWDLDADTLASIYFWREEELGRGSPPAQMEIEGRRNELYEEVVRIWSERLAHPSAGHKLIAAIQPVLRQWLNRSHGNLNFRLTQVLSGHGCFGRYLCRIAGREGTERCHHCDGPSDTAQHTLESCPAWEEQRQVLSAVIGRDLSLRAVVEAMVDVEEKWEAVESFCESVILQKEAAEREREIISTDLIRRRRTGRRRRHYALHLPP